MDFTTGYSLCKVVAYREVLFNFHSLAGLLYTETTISPLASLALEHISRILFTEVHFHTPQARKLSSFIHFCIVIKNYDLVTALHSLLSFGLHWFNMRTLPSSVIFEMLWRKQKSVQASFWCYHLKIIPQGTLVNCVSHKGYGACCAYHYTFLVTPSDQLTEPPNSSLFLWQQQTMTRRRVLSGPESTGHSVVPMTTLLSRPSLGPRLQILLCPDPVYSSFTINI